MLCPLGPRLLCGYYVFSPLNGRTACDCVGMRPFEKHVCYRTLFKSKHIVVYTVAGYAFKTVVFVYGLEIISAACP